jgi:hypothetical protein
MTSMVSLSIWIVANLVYLLLSAICMVSIHASGDFWEGLGLILLFSSVFSLPGIVVFWLLFLFNCRSQNLFTILLITASVTSFSSVLLLLVISSIAPGQVAHLFVMAVLSSVTAVMLHRPAIMDVLVAQNNILHSKDSEALET